MSQAIRPHTGKVNIQAETISAPTPHLTADSLRVAPTPMIAVLMVCVVLRGIPKVEASIMTRPEAVSAAKPWTGFSFVIPIPIVRMILHPPQAVPTPIVPAHSRMIQVGM